MARPRSVSDDDLLVATGRVLRRLGPVRFTLADVAGEAGLSPATLVQRFGGKRGLVLAFARAEAIRAGEPFAAARRRHASPRAALEAALVAASADVGSRQEVANGLAVLIDDLGDDELREAAAQHARASEQAIRGLVDEAIEAGELVTDDPAGLALAVLCAWNGAIIQWALRGEGRFAALLGQALAPLWPEQKRRKR